MKKIIFLLLIAISIISCNKNKEDEELLSDGNFVSGSFMDGFYTPNAMTVKDIYYDNPIRGIEIELKTNTHIFVPEIQYKKDIPDEDKKIFDKYVNYYGDINSTQKHYAPHLKNFGCKYPVDNISIVADKDFDSNHPAGSELNDLFIFKTDVEYISIIESGYDEKLVKYYNPKRYPLNELSNYKLLYNNFILAMPNNPSDSGLYTFTVTINFLTDPVSGEECESIKQAITMKF